MTSMFRVQENHRDDIKLSGLAIFYGFKVDCKSPNDSYKFEHGDYTVWSIREGWQTALLTDGIYTDHKPFLELSDALQYVYERA